MRIFLIISLLLTNVLSAQQTNVEFDKTMFNLINIYRKENNKKPINWSNEIYKISKIQLHRTDSVLHKDKNRFNLKHDIRLLNKYNISEIIAYHSSDSFIYNKFDNPLLDIKFTNFLKKYFFKLYKETIIKVKVLKDLGNGKYLVDEIKDGVYSYNGNAIYIDSTSNGKTYIRTYGVKLSTKKIKVNACCTLSIGTQMELKAAYVIMMWHFSVGHRKIMLSVDSKIGASANLIRNNILVSTSNFKYIKI